MGDQIQSEKPAGTFVMSAKTISQQGQCLLTVCKNGKRDNGGNPLVQIQVPTDFAAYLLHLQDAQREIDEALDRDMKNCQTE